MKHLHKVQVFFFLSLLMVTTLCANVFAADLSAAVALNFGDERAPAPRVTLSKGQSGNNYSELGGTIAQGYRDIIRVRTLEAGTLTVNIADTYSHGESMSAAALVFTPGQPLDLIPLQTEIAPTPVNFSIPLSRPSFVFIVAGYSSAPFFPTGYDWTVSLD